MLLSLLSRRTLEADSRDSYGFAVRPQHLQTYREYGHIYKQEEEERSEKWKIFLEQCSESAKQCTPAVKNLETSKEGTARNSEATGQNPGGGDDSIGEKSTSGTSTEVGHEKEVPAIKEAKRGKIKTWATIRPSLHPIEKMMSVRVKKKVSMQNNKEHLLENNLPPVNKEIREKENSKVASQKSYVNTKIPINSHKKDATLRRSQDKDNFPWKEELESLVHGGIPKPLRGEVWQAFAGVRARKVERYYQELLSAQEVDLGSDDKNLSDAGGNGTTASLPEKLRKQIEKDLSRTFPGHPALDEEGRNSLRRILTAYALHNPSVGYCQAMNFFAGLFLLLMPEENAFWTLVGIIDEYFNGYYTQEMIESQVDQLVFEELMRERFPKLVNHLDFLGVEVAWVSGPWFLSIFVNMLPWESVLRVWDVILYEGNRVMLFRTALALMELYGPALVTTKDAGDVLTLLQSLTGSTFDSSQLVLTACMGFLAVTETRLEELRNKHRPSVLGIIEERTKGSEVSKESKGLASKLYSFKHDAHSRIEDPDRNEKFVGKQTDSASSTTTASPDNFDDFICSLNIDAEFDTVIDLQEQVVYLKVELCRLMEEKRVATLRAEELETAFLEMVKEDNRRQLSARVEHLEQEATLLCQTLQDKMEQERAMLQVLMRVEQEQKVAENVRIAAEQDVAAHKCAVIELQEKYDKAMTSLAEMEKRAVMAESMLEATLQYETGQAKATSSPRSMRGDSPRTAKRTSILSSGLAWRDRNKGRSSNEADQGENRSVGKSNREEMKQSNVEESNENQPADDVSEKSPEQSESTVDNVQ